MSSTKTQKEKLKSDVKKLPTYIQHSQSWGLPRKLAFAVTLVVRIQVEYEAENAKHATQCNRLPKCRRVLSTGNYLSVLQQASSG